MKKIKYLIISICLAIWHDLKKGYNGLDNPKEILNILFYILIIEILTNRKMFAYITLVLSIIVYIWKIIKQGDWRHRIREDYKRM